jgi:hypothetical protein
VNGVTIKAPYGRTRFRAWPFWLGPIEKQTTEGCAERLILQLKSRLLLKTAMADFDRLQMPTASRLNTVELVKRHVYAIDNLVEEQALRGLRRG